MYLKIKCRVFILYKLENGSTDLFSFRLVHLNTRVVK